MNEPIDFLHSYCDFSDPNMVWILTGISRNKDHDLETETHEKFIHRRILACPEDLDRFHREIHLLAADPDTTYRMYISLNSRDVIKAALNFQKSLFDLNIGLARGYADALALSKKLDHMWKTELAQKENRGTKRMLLDLDTQEPLHINGLLNCINDSAFLQTTKIHVIRKTVNGYHIVLDACDTRVLIKHCEEKKIPIDMKQLHRDSMLFVEQWKCCS